MSKYLSALHSHGDDVGFEMIAMKHYSGEAIIIITITINIITIIINIITITINIITITIIIITITINIITIIILPSSSSSPSSSSPLHHHHHSPIIIIIASSPYSLLYVIHDRIHQEQLLLTVQTVAILSLRDIDIERTRCIIIYLFHHHHHHHHVCLV